MGYFIKGVLNRLSVNEIKFYMINNMIPSVVRQIPSLPKTYFVRDIISYGYFGDVTRQRGTPFDEENEQGALHNYLEMTTNHDIPDQFYQTVCILRKFNQISTKSTCLI